MKANQRTIKVYDASHKLAAELSNRFNISMTAVVEIGLRTIAAQPSLIVPPVHDARSKKANCRTALTVKTAKSKSAK